MKSHFSGYEKEGKLLKRGGRMLRWTSRYFLLQGPKLIYKLNQSSVNIRGEFDLAPGCIVTEIQEDYVGTIKGKKVFSFWLVWPHDKHHKYIDSKAVKDNEIEGDLDDSGDEDDEGKDISKSLEKLKRNSDRGSLVDIINNEKLQQKEQASKVAEQIERHQIHDKNISTGAKVALFATGGVIIGVFTAGIGLIPYVTVAAVAAVAGGAGVALQIRTQYKRPADSRLVLACETMNEAIAWKISIENQIEKLDKKVILSSSTNPLIISNIICLSSGEDFKLFEIYEGMRILCHADVGTMCMKAQLVVRSTPFLTFLSVMDGSNWPSQGCIKVLKSVDDHTDVIEVEVISDCRKYGGSEFVKRKIKFFRFWKTDEEGIYLIALNSTVHYEEGDDDHNKEVQTTSRSTGNASKNSSPVSVDAVITISPRNDNTEFDNNLKEALVKCTCQVSQDHWAKGELESFMTDFLKQQLLELNQNVLSTRFPIHTAVAANGSNHDGSHSPNFSFSKQQAPPKIGSPTALTPITSMYDTAGSTLSLIAHTPALAVSSLGVQTKQPDSDATLRPKSQSRRFLFRRPKNDDSYLYGSSSSKIPSSANPENIIVQLPNKKQTKAVNRIRTKEANQLRQNIAMKEYCVKRIQKEILRNQHKDKSNENNSIMAEHAVNLQNELNELKAEYLKISGKQFEHSVFDRTKRAQSFKKYFSARMTTSGSSNENDASKEEQDFIFPEDYNSKDSNMPYHWTVPVRSLRFDVLFDSKDSDSSSILKESLDVSAETLYKSKNEFLVTMSMSLWICLSLAATLFCSKFLSSF